jgi:hypothetical protein
MFSRGRDWLPSRVEIAVVTCLVLLGVALRLRQYFSARSLWLDEAAVAVSVVDRNLISLLSTPLKWNQSAPPGFLVASRSFVALLGREEWVLWLSPLIAGLLIVVVAVVLARHELKSMAGRVTFVSLVALSPVLISYSSEFKQYSFDALVASCILLAVSYSNSRYGTWLLAVTGFVGILCSLPAVFVAAPAAVLIAYEAIRSRQWRQVISVGLAWSVAAAIHFGYFLFAGPDRDHFVRWWADFHPYAPFPPSSVADLRWYPRSLLDLSYLAFRNTGHAVPRVNPPWLDVVDWSLALALLLATIAVIASGRRTALVAVGGILTAYVASALEAYPFSSRLLIFCVPLTLFIIATGIDELRRTTGPLMTAVASGLLLSVMIPSAVERAQQPYFSSDMRGALAEVSRGFEEGDVIALWRSGKLFGYYGRALIPQGTPVFGLNADNPRLSLIDIAEKNGYRRIWVIAAHRTQTMNRLIRRTASTVPIAYEWRVRGTRVVLFDFRRRM